MQSEPTTADDIPVLDAATLALGALLATPAAPNTPSPSSATLPASDIPAAAPAFTPSPAAPAPAVHASRSTSARHPRPSNELTSTPWRSGSTGSRPAHLTPVRTLPAPPTITVCPLAPLPPAATTPRATTRARRRPITRRGLAAAVLAVCALTVGTTGVFERPAPAAESTASGPIALAHAAGAAVSAHATAEVTPAAAVADGQVVVALIAPTEALKATPVLVDAPSIAERLGTLVALSR